MSDTADHTNDGLTENLLRDLVASLDRSVADQARLTSDAKGSPDSGGAILGTSGLVESLIAGADANNGSPGESIVGALTSIVSPIAALGGAIGSLLGLFGGGDSTAPAALPKFRLPPQENTLLSTSADTNWALSPSDYASGNVVRSQAAQPQQVVVQVNAIDSRSFLDHRDAIASAVRQALLESHGLGDVLRGE